MGYGDKPGSGGGAGEVIPPPLFDGQILVGVGGNWVPDFAEVYLTQAAWFVDADTGSDTNDGATALTALETLDELARRWSGRTFADIPTVDVTLSGTFPVTDHLVLEANFVGQTVVTVRGTMTTVDTGTLTAAFVAMNAATGVRALLTDAAQDFTTHVHRRIRMTSGAANNAVTWICSLGGGVTLANVGQFWSDTTLGGSSATPANGDSYAIETFTTRIQDYYIDLRGPVFFAIKDIEFVAVVPGFSGFSGPESKMPRLRSRCYGCGFTSSGFAQFIISGNNTLAACSFLWDTNNGSGIVFRDGELLENAFCWFGFSQTDNVSVVAQHNIHDGNGTLHVGRLLGNRSNQEDIHHRGFFGCIDGTITELIRIEDNAQHVGSGANARFWGAAGNTASFALRVRNGCGFSYVTLPTATGNVPGSDVVLATAAVIAWATLPAVAAPPSNAFANLRA